VNTSTGGGGGGDIVVSGYAPTSIGYTLGGSPNKIQQALNQKTEAPFDGITAIGNRFGNTFGVNLGGNQFGASGQDRSAFDRLTDPNEILVRATPATQASSVSIPVTGGLSSDVLAGMAEFEKNPIVSEGSKIERPTSVGFPNLDFGVIDRLSGMENYAEEPIDVIGSKRVEPTSVSVVPPRGSVVDTLPSLDLKADPTLTDKDGNKLGLEEYLRLAALAAGLVGGGKGGSGSSGTYAPGGRGLNPIFSAKLPTSRIPGGVGSAANLAPRKLGPQDWETYGQRPEISFYNYVPEPTGMAEGGMFAAKRGGPSRRTEFAVNGAGTGRSDDIPAVLSDGEYVIDAETVALLGDGSSKAGAKTLDELRVKVRKHKGQKLAKGRFSANAKKPEAYLSGGLTR
jgi:hypothetical protein